MGNNNKKKTHVSLGASQEAQVPKIDPIMTHVARVF